MNSYSTILLLASILALLFAYIVFRRRAVPGARSLMLLVLAIGVWSSAYACELNARQLPSILFWARVEYIGVVLVPLAWLAFTQQYTQSRNWLTPRNIALLAIIPLLTLLLVWSNDLHRLIWVNVGLLSRERVTLGVFNYGIAFWIFVIYSYILIAIGSYYIFRFIYRSQSFFRWQGILLLSGAMVPWVANFVYLFNLYPSLKIDPTPLAFVISALAYTLALLKYGLLDILPVARARLITDMQDGLIVLDAQDRIVDINPAAEKIFDVKAPAVIRKDIESVNGRGSQLIAALNGDIQPSVEIMIGEGGEKSYYDVRSSTLRDAAGSQTGRMIVLRDVTERVKTLDALNQRGAILETVSFAATRFLASSSWEETVPELLERLGLSVHASRVYIYQNFMDDGRGLRAHLLYEWTAPGISPLSENQNRLNIALQEVGLGRWEEILGNNQPVYSLVECLPESENVLLLDQGILSIATVPIFWGNQWWGTITFEDHSTPHRWMKEEIEALQAAAGALGSSIQRLNAEENMRRRTAELATLHQISVEITSPKELPTLLNMIVERAVVLLGGTSGGLYLCEPKTKEVVCVTCINTTRDYTGVRLKFGEGAAGIVAQTGKPLVIDDYRQWKGRAGVFEREQPFRSVVSAPLMWQGEVLGVIHILHDCETHRYTEADLTLLTLFANQAAVALHNAQVYTDTQRRARRSALINEITHLTISTSDLNSTLHDLAGRLVELFGADGAYIAFWDETQGTAIPKAAYGDMEEIYPAVEPFEGEASMTTSVLQCGHVLVEEDVFRSDYISPRNAAMFPAKSMIGLPLIADGRKLGAALITYGKAHKFTVEEIALSEEVSTQIALTVSKVRLLDIERRRADELDALRATVSDISAELELDSLLKAILERATTLLNATGGELGLFDEAKKEIQIVVSHNMGKDLSGTYLEWGEGAIGKAIETDRTVVVTDYLRWEGRSSKYKDTPSMAALAVPLHIRGRIAGALKIVETNPMRKFSPEDQRLLDLFAQQAANAIENARLYANEKQRASELKILFESSSAMVNTLELSKVYQIAIQQLGQAVHATSAHLLTCDLETGIAVVLAEYFSPQANRWETRSNLGASYNLNDYPQTLISLRSGRPLVIRISNPDADIKDLEELAEYHAKSSMNIPMIVSDNVLGYVEIWDSVSERAWNEDELRLAQTLANQAAIVIENARLYNKMEQMAVTDMLTGAYNRRGLFEVGEREISRAMRLSKPLSVVMLDIDLFKQINDHYGHAVGDQVLQKLAKLCQKNLRNIDIFGRYGGDEFAILLPETDMDTASHVAQRLRQRVSETPFVVESVHIPISISLGLACTNGEIPNLAVLLDCADSAMYQAKQTGRNQVFGA